MHDSKVRSRLKAQLTKFCTELCGGLSKPLGKFVAEMLFGIQSSQDVKLSNIGRALGEAIPLIRTEKRLSRNLKHVELEAELTARLVEMASPRIQQDTVLALDLSDIRKEYARKMEHLATVWDGSSGETHPGYWLVDVTGAEVHGSEIVPVCQKLFSAKAKEFRSENAETSPSSTRRIGILAVAASGRWIAAATARSCWNPCWTRVCASSSAPPASVRFATGAAGCAAWRRSL